MADGLCHRWETVPMDVEGGVWSWGRGEWGRLGHGDASDRLSPELLEEGPHLAPASAHAVSARAETPPKYPASHAHAPSYATAPWPAHVDASVKAQRAPS